MTITKKYMNSLLAVFILALSGCSTMQDVVKAKESGSEGTTQSYQVTENQAWDIAKTVFRWEGSDAIEEHKDQHYMLTSSGMNMVSYGAVMGAWITPINDLDTKVTVVTKRRLTLNVATTLTESTFHRRFAQAVEIVKKGKPLPASAP
ncbi:hypothetical protein [Methylotenera versatilis]|uniref:Lipoprotein n=1 Tax=Methylotenera versatilis (strain 301) TaxID=666681 RepID=D7DKW0_METV0|nr:hypothetical protein [Methylotenera versatilis]ADI28571.1 conserved hypothetical protein [Methylotenera versatilis 301]